MATFTARATPEQLATHRMILGAVKNALYAHPEWRTMDSERLARSIAKRAAGTLTAAKRVGVGA